MKGQMWIPVFIAIGFLMAFPVAELVLSGNWEEVNMTREMAESLFRNLWKDGFLITGTVITFGAAFISGINGFWYLYSPSKVDFYHCLPVKREVMFLQKTISGVVYFLVPYAVMEFLAICIGAMKGYFSLEIMVNALQMLLIHLLIYFMVYFGVVLAICLTGNMLMGALVMAGIFLYGPAAGILINGSKALFFSTYQRNFAVGLTSVEKLFSPFTLSFSLVTEYAGGEAGKTLAAVGIFALLAAVGSFFAYVKRPMETAGKSVVYKFTGVIIEFLIVIPVGVGVGHIFYLLQHGTNAFWWIFGMIFGAVLAHGMLQVIYHLDFRMFFSHKVQLLLAGACVALCAVTLKFDLVGFDAYIPAYEKMEGIGLNLKEISGNEQGEALNLLEDGTWELAEDKNGIAGNISISPEIYELLDGLAAEQRQRGIRFMMHSYDLEEDARAFTLKYICKSGREIYRRYIVTVEELRELLAACYETGNLKESKYSFLQIEPQYLTQITGRFATGEFYVLFQDDKERFAELTEALMKDIEEADSETLLGVPCAILAFQYYGLPMKGSDIQNFRYYGDAYVYPEYKRTVAILKETGYPFTMEEVKLESAKYYYYDPEYGAGNGYGAETVITDAAQLAEMQKGMVAYAYTPSWVETEKNLDVSVRSESTSANAWLSMEFLKGQVPEFIRKQVEADKEFEGSDSNYASEQVQVDYN